MTLPELLLAERAGRALAGRMRHDCDILAATSLAGAAAVAAGRHLANLGFSVRILLEDASAHTHAAFACLLESIACMNLPLLQPGSRPESGFLIDGTAFGAPSGTGAKRRLSAREFLDPTHSAHWDGFSLEGNPFVRLVTPEIVRQRPALYGEDVRKIDHDAMADYGLPGLCLMENAAIGATVVAAEMLRVSGDSRAPVVVFAGPGNNGGDALAVARGLSEYGCRVQTVLLGDPLRLKGDAKTNLDLLSQSGAAIATLQNTDLPELLNQAALAVDGLFGTGLARPLDGEAAALTAQLNELRKLRASGDRSLRTLSLDIPSGLNADSGEPMGVCVQADTTVTFAALKPGLLRCPDICGTLYLADIGCPAELLA